MEGSNVAPMSCARCRERRVKCDRRIPGCERCEKSSHDCPGYNRARRFQDEGIKLRKRFAKKINLDSSSHTRHDGSTVPSRRVQRAPDSLPSTPLTTDTPTTLTLDTTIDATYFDLDPDVYYSQENNACGLIPGLPLVEDVESFIATSAVPSESRKASAQGSAGHPPPIGAVDTSRNSRLTENVLIRRYVDIISPWLDVFDKDKYFGHIVPVNARHSKLLKDVIHAVAAKQFDGLGQESSNRNNGRSVQSQLGMELLYSKVDWSYQAASFYDIAIRRMIAALRATDIGGGNLEKQSTTSDPGNQETVESMLAAVSVFLLYDFIDHGQLGISQHMTGALHLLNHVVQDRPAFDAVDTLSPHPPTLEPHVAIAWQASFWNFASFDYIASYTAKAGTRLYFGDSKLWEASGLPMTVIDGHHLPSSLAGRGVYLAPTKMTETLACRTLIWIVLKTLDCISCNDQPKERTADRRQHRGPNYPESPERMISYWNQIDKHLSDWYSALPVSFAPCISLPKPRTYSLTSTTSTTPSPAPTSAIQIPFPELFYSGSMGATAILLYHFTRILLLLNKPITHEDFNSQTGVGRLGAYRQFSQQIDEHVQEICGIAIGRPQPAVDIHLVQPLHLAGKCLESQEQRVVLADLLIGLERRTGCSTKWSIIQLKEHWGWEKVNSS